MLLRELASRELQLSSGSDLGISYSRAVLGTLLRRCHLAVRPQLLRDLSHLHRCRYLVALAIRPQLPRDLSAVLGTLLPRCHLAVSPQLLRDPSYLCRGCRYSISGHPLGSLTRRGTRAWRCMTDPDTAHPKGENRSRNKDRLSHGRLQCSCANTV